MRLLIFLSVLFLFLLIEPSSSLPRDRNNGGRRVKVPEFRPKKGEVILERGNPGIQENEKRESKIEDSDAENENTVADDIERLEADLIGISGDLDQLGLNDDDKEPSFADNDKPFTQKEKRSFKGFFKKLRNIVKEILNILPIVSKFTKKSIIKDKNGEEPFLIGKNKPIFEEKKEKTKETPNKIETLDEAMKALENDLGKIGAEVGELEFDFDIDFSKPFGNKEKRGFFKKIKKITKNVTSYIPLINRIARDLSLVDAENNIESVDEPSYSNLKSSDGVAEEEEIPKDEKKIVKRSSSIVNSYKPGSIIDAIFG